MPMLERRPGCDPSDALCEGVAGPYWTFLDTPVRLLWVHALGALALVGLVLLVLVLVRRRRHWPPTWRDAGVAAGAWVATFLALAALFPMTVNY